MATESAHMYGVLPEQAQEGKHLYLHSLVLHSLIISDALHANRLLNVEEKHFHRVAKTLLAPHSPLRTLPRGSDGAKVPPNPTNDELFNRQKFREEVLLDFASLEGSLRRIQLIQSSNERERQRYATEKAKILETAQAVRDNSVELRVQLEEAQRVLELRKGYDELATRILDDKKLKSREESLSDIEKLEKEIEDLQQESGEYEGTWLGRKEQFDRIVTEGEAMVRLIKGIKIDPERAEDETMDEDDENDEDEDAEDADGSQMVMSGIDGQTPMHEGAMTPQGEGDDGESITVSTSYLKSLDVNAGTRRDHKTSQGDQEMADSNTNGDGVAAPEAETMDES
nr:hypothetical protein CFP56_09623 [Quercus suber]